MATSAVIAGRALASVVVALGITALLLALGWIFYGAAVPGRTAPALAVTVIVVGAALIGYSKKTPTDKYIRSIDATVYATGNPASNAVPSSIGC